jgi:pSer/pThr/pTyr-binding forkhead associated (FHA) protein/tetratricopeptide (TPR) repeat protein
MPILTISRDGVVEQQISLEKDVTTLGRLEDNDVVLRDGSISRHHAQIERHGGQFIIKDLGSQNGIWVGGSRVTQVDLKPGAQLVIGVFTAAFDPGVGGYAAASPPLAYAAAKLFVLDGPLVQREFSLHHPETHLGRSSTCEIPIDHEAVSKNHAKIAFQNNQFILNDTGSRNGVFVNGLRIDSHVLQHRDEIEIGPVRFAFSETGEYIAPMAGVPERAAMPPSAPGYVPAPMARAEKRSLFARVPKIAWIAAAAGIVIIIVLVALVSGPPQAERPSAREVSTENQQTIQKLLSDGKQYFAAGDFQGALEKANAVLVPELDPTNREALDLQAHAQEKLREQAAARAKAEEDAAQRAAKVQALLNGATTSFKANNLEDAKAKLVEARTLDPENADVKKLLGGVYIAVAKAAQKKRDYKGAFDAYDEALQLDPANAEARKGRDGLASSEQATKAREARSHTLFEEAKRAIQSGDSLKAYRDLTQVLDLNPNYPQASNLLNQVKTLLEIKAKPLYDEGTRLYNAGQLAEAMRKFNQVLEIFPDHAPTQQVISQARMKLRAAAQETYRRGYIAEGLGKYREALDLYQKTLNLLPDANEEYHKKAADKISQLKDRVK